MACLVAVLVTTVALAVRWLLNPILGESLSFVTFFPAVAFAVWFGGWVPGTLTAVLSLFIANYIYAAAHSSLFSLTVPEVVRSFAFSLASLIVILFGNSMRRAKVAESLAAEKQNQLEQLVQHLPDLVFQVDKDLRHLFVSPNIEAFSGIAPERFIGKTGRELGLPEEFYADFEAVARETLATGAERQVELKHRGRVFRSRLFPQRQHDGSIIGLWAISEDITERRMAEAELARSRALFEGITEATPDILYLHDLIDNKNLYINREITTQLGYTPEQIRSFGSEVTRRLAPPEDAVRRQEFLKKFASAADGQTLEHERRVRHANGEYRWYRDRAVVFSRDEGGRARVILGVAQDVTERRRILEALERSEARLRHALAAGGLGAWEWDIPHNNVIWSDRLYEIHGLARAEFENTTQALDKLVHPEDLPKVHGALKEALENRKPYDLEFRILRPNGEIRWLSTSSILFHDGDTPVKMIGITADVTEDRIAREALAEAKDQLARSNERLEMAVQQRTEDLQQTIRALEDVAYTIAHDLRAPLRALNGFAMLLQEDYAEKLDATGVEYLQRISGSALRMDELVTDLLEYARLSHTDLPIERVNLNLQMKRVLAQLEPEIHRLQAKVVVEHDLPPVMGNATGVSQVLANLLTNSLKFVGAESLPEVRITAGSEAGRVRVTVQDNGIGIAPEHQKRIFGLFQRLHARESYPGTGIGLAIVEKAAERMGGNVGVESETGRGSRFWFELPAATSAPEGADFGA